MRPQRTPLLAMTLASALFGSMGSMSSRQYAPQPYTGGGHQPYKGRGRSRKNLRKSPFRGMTYSNHHAVEAHYELGRSVA